MHIYQKILLLLIPLLLSPAVTTLSRQNAHNEPASVIVEQARMDNFHDSIEALGTLRANETVEITADVTETVATINFDDGQRVKRGDVLVEMNSDEEKALMREIRAEVEEAEKQLERVRMLSERGAASESLLDEWQRSYDTAVARLAVIKSRIEDRIIRAPFDGVVGLRNISVGALVEPGTLITTLNDDSRMKLDFTVPSVYLQILEKGLPVTARSKALGQSEFRGEIYSIDNKVDPVTRSVTVRALLPNDRGVLKQGLLMSVELYKNPRETVVISEEALIPEGETNFILVVREEENGPVAEKREVEIGSRRVGEVEIISGLNPGEKVVTHGTMKVRGGQRVKITAFTDGSEPLPELLDNNNPDEKVN